MGKRSRRSTAGNRSLSEANKRRDRAFWAFLIAAVAIAGGMYWGISQKTAESSASEASTYTPSTALTVPKAPPVTVKRPSNGPLQVMFIGDSITRGSGASTEAETFRAKVTRRLEESGPVKPIVSAIGGARLKEVADATSVSWETDLAIIELGTNDSGDGPTPLPEYRQQYAALIQKVKTAAPDAALMCVGIWRTTGTDFDWVMQTECEKAGGTFVALGGLAGAQANRGPEGRPVYSSANGNSQARGIGDNFHPNDTGYTAIADLIMKNLTVA